MFVFFTLVLYLFAVFSNFFLTFLHYCENYLPSTPPSHSMLHVLRCFCCYCNLIWREIFKSFWKVFIVGILSVVGWHEKTCMFQSFLIYIIFFEMPNMRKSFEYLCTHVYEKNQARSVIWLINKSWKFGENCDIFRCDLLGRIKPLEMNVKYQFIWILEEWLEVMKICNDSLLKIYF